MLKAFYTLIAANLSAAAVFFVSGIIADHGLLYICSSIFALASLLLLLLLMMLRHRAARVESKLRDAQNLR